MGNCKGKLSKSEKTKLREDAYVKNRDKIDHGRDGPTVHSKADIDENEERSAHAKISTIPVNAIDHGKDGPAVHKKTDVDENEESSTHTKISTKPVIAIDHGKDGQTVHKKTDVDENEEKNKMSTESNIIEHANDGPTINQLPIVSNNSDPSTSAFESKNQHENNVPEIKDTNFKTENSGDNLICTKENSRPSKKDTNVTGNETHVTIEPTNGINRVQKEMKKKNQDPIAQQTERQMYNFTAGYTADSDIEEEDTPVVTPDLNVNTGDIHCTDIDLNQNTGDKHGTDLSQNAGEKNTTDLSGEEATPLLDMKKMKALAEVSSSVGMFKGNFIGSCWRAGTDLIVTSWNVVRGQICEYGGLNDIKLKEVKIKFDYTGSGDCEESNIFDVEPNVLYHNETLDTAILRLKPNGKVIMFPPPFRRLDHFLIPAKDENQTIYLIGHPDGSPQRVNLDVRLWNPTEERMQSLETFCKDEGYGYGYAELDKAERLIVKCQFEHGTSGCPGVVFLGDNQVYVVLMFLRGFPDFYFSKLFKWEQKKKFPKSKLFQHGVNIGAIYEDLKKNPMYADIFEDIFIKQNPSVNMGPSGIIPSENYTDGCQDCHGGVSTSTQPTSDEGTHHVRSPCEEETNENVSTMERQGSQMVASGETTLDMKIMKVLAKVSKSVGMFEGKTQGSCWRAGTDLIVTAWHVVHNHIRVYGGLNEIKLKEVKIKFDYTGSGDCDESNIFEIEPKVLYKNETLDTAILRLKPNGKVVTFPPPFRRLDHFLIPAKDEDQSIYLIGHPDGLPQRVNLHVGLWNPTDERMQSLETFCRDKGYENGYTELDKSERLVVKCQFEYGASSCPGVVVLDDNQLYLVTMFLRGFPDFYFSKLFKGEQKKKFPKTKLFQQGVNIRAIYEDLKNNLIHADIFQDIFIE